MSASASSSSSRWTYHVFLSFRGEDTRKGFVDHLYYALDGAGIYTFRDDIELRRGENISMELKRAIQESQICLIVFSKGYADSTWCLEELEEIVFKCPKGLGYKLIPIFYDVSPSDVRNQLHSFAEAFESYEKRFVNELDRVKRWRVALKEAADSSGWDLSNCADGHEGKFIKKIVEEISHLLNISSCLDVPAFSIGIDSRADKLSMMLDVGEMNAQMIGIYGMGGVGKTTVAKAIYNRFLQHFEGKSFLTSVREKDLVNLQEQLLSDVLPATETKISNTVQGVTIIKDKIGRRRVLIILDDVDDSVQVHSLARVEWFCAGSRIIITTREKRLLEMLGVHKIHDMEKDLLSPKESLELFSWHAFHKNQPDDDFVKLSNEIVAYCGGLPLAVEVLGSFLFGRDIVAWKSQMEKLKTIPYKPITEQLRISYDGLDGEMKKAFLDISCFFTGMDKDTIVRILDGCKFFGAIAMSVLISKCLVKVDREKKITMHDLVRDMGREVVRESFPDDPEKRSRLWDHKDVLKVLKGKRGTKAIEGLASEFQIEENKISMEAFRIMKRLRLLRLDYAQPVGSFDSLFEELRWLCWHGFPLEIIPSNLKLEELVVLDMQYSKLVEIWKDAKCLPNLKVLRLSHSHKLTKSPDFSNVPNLEELELDDCPSLVELHPSIEKLKKLRLLNLRHCINLRRLPKRIGDLKSLEILDLTDCSKIEKLPSSVWGLRKLEIFRISQRGRSSEQSSQAFLFLPQEMSRLILSCVNFLPVLGPRFLSDLHISGSSVSKIPGDIGSLSSLKRLILEGEHIESLPDSLCHLPNLKALGITARTSSSGILAHVYRKLRDTDISYLDCSRRYFCHMVPLFLERCIYVQDWNDKFLLKMLEEKSMGLFSVAGSDIPEHRFKHHFFDFKFSTGTNNIIAEVARFSGLKHSDFGPACYCCPRVSEEFHSPCLGCFTSVVMVVSSSTDANSPCTALLIFALADLTSLSYKFVDVLPFRFHTSHEDRTIILHAHMLTFSSIKSGDFIYFAVHLPKGVEVKKIGFRFTPGPRNFSTI